MCLFPFCTFSLRAVTSQVTTSPPFFLNASSPFPTPRCSRYLRPGSPSPFPFSCTALEASTLFFSFRTPHLCSHSPSVQPRKCRCNRIFLARQLMTSFPPQELCSSLTPIFTDTRKQFPYVFSCPKIRPPPSSAGLFLDPPSRSFL